ncbi:hypothetical protein D7I39_11135 [Allopusillimonas ginsengisoli]|nr:hypothetical protein D7I39_11135 [Allopusillimonas ginsengisoli]
MTNHENVLNPPLQGGVDESLTAETINPGTRHYYEWLAQAMTTSKGEALIDAMRHCEKAYHHMIMDGSPAACRAHDDARAEFARIVAAYVAPVSDHVVCGAQNGECDTQDAIATAMLRVADQYAHVMAMHLECILLNYGGPFSDEAMKTLGSYRAAMDSIHEAESPTHRGEPLIARRRITGD